MKREKQLAKDTIIIGIGTFLPKLFSIVTLPIITGYLTKAEYGTYDLILTLISLVLPIATLQIQSAAFRFLVQCRDDDMECKTILSTIFLFTVSMSILPIIVIYFVIGNYSISTKIIICLYFAGDILLHTSQQAVRGLGRTFYYSLSTIIVSLSNMLLLIVFVRFFKAGFNGILGAIVLANYVAALFLFIKSGLYKYISLSAFDRSTLKSMLAYSWPMIPNNLSSWVMTLSDRLLLIFFFGVEANAVYAVAKKLPNLLASLQSTFSLAWQENASISANDSDIDEYYSGMFDSVFNIVIGATAGLIGFAPILFSVLIRGSYLEAYSQLPILFLGMTFSILASYLAGIYIAERRTKEIGITTSLAAIMNLIIDVVAMPRFGLWAASTSTLLSYMFLFFYRAWDLKNYRNIKYKRAKNIISMTIIIAMCILSSFNIKSINIIIFIWAIFFSLLLNRNLIEAFIQLLKRG